MTSQLVLASSPAFTSADHPIPPSPSPPPFFRKIRLSKDLISLFDVFPNFVRNMLCSENSKYQDLVYYFLVITLFARFWARISFVIPIGFPLFLPSPTAECRQPPFSRRAKFIETIGEWSTNAEKFGDN